MIQQTFFCIRPYAFPQREAIKSAIRAHGLTIRETRVGWLSVDDVGELYGHERPSVYFDACCEFMTSGFVEFGVAQGDQAILSLKMLAGMSHIPIENPPDTLRYQFGKIDPVDFCGVSYYHNPTHRSNDSIEAAREVALFDQWKKVSLSETLSRMMWRLHKDKNLACVFHHHVSEVVRIGRLLSAKYGANQERVELACWLHDISSLKSGNKQDHHIKGAQEAGEILSVLGCGVDDICSVQHSIRCHRGSNMGEQMSLEAAIVCTADAIANIGKPFLLSYFAFGVKGLDFENGLAAIRSKVVRSYDKIPGFLKGEAEASLRLWEQLGVL